MVDNCEFQDLKNSLIRDHIVFGVTDQHMRERLLRVLDLMLDKALEISRESVEANAKSSRSQCHRRKERKLSQEEIGREEIDEW